MKKLIVAAAVLVWSGAAFAGDYHQSSTLKCSECHTMHASRAHGINSLAADLGWTAPAFPNDKLLVQAGVNVTCLTCHDAQPLAPDVFARKESAPAVLDRSAGALNGTVSGKDNTGYQPWMGHTLGSQDPPPGYTGTWDPADEGFHCGNCHSIHGSNFFRNLGGGKVGTAGQKATLAFDGIGPVHNSLASGRAVNVNQDVFVNNALNTFLTSEVEFRIGQNGMNNYCAVCHGLYHNTAASTQNTVATNGVNFVRHPTSGELLGLLGRSTVLPATTSNAVALVRPAYDAAAGTAAEAACLSCHKGHGNQRGFGLLYPETDATGAFLPNADLENGDAPATLVNGVNTYPIRNLCTVCHPY